MKTFLQTATFIVFLGMFFISCSDTDSNSQNTNQTASANQSFENANSTKDDAEGLGMIVKLPFESEDAVWREEKLVSADENGRLPSQNETKLTAVLLFKAEDAEKIVAQAQTYKQTFPTDIASENWFPAELIAQSQLSGDETVKGTTYAANDFFQSPYTDGKITRIQASNYFILELYSR